MLAGALQAHISTANPIAKKEFKELPKKTAYFQIVNMINSLLAGKRASDTYGDTESGIKPKPMVETEQADELSLVTRYAGMGYNLLTGNPEGDFSIGGADPGIKTTKFIFKHTYTKGDENDAYYRGHTLKVPDQVTFLMTAGCSSSQRSDAYSGQASYREELLQNVDASGMQL